MKEILVKHPKITSRRSSLISNSNTDIDIAQIPNILIEKLTNVDPETNDDIDLAQTLDAEDMTNRLVKFAPLTVWNNSEDNEVEYILPVDYSEYQLDLRLCTSLICC